MKGKLIAIEGSDGSGKGTQADELYRRLEKEGYPVRKVEFPNYRSSSSALIQMYLEGSFGTAPGAVSPYIASTFYAVDRYATYKTEWEDFYLGGGIVIADRYTTANMVHQGAKLPPGEEQEKYLEWLLDFEYRLFRLPPPDRVIFLDMPPEFSKKLLAEREDKKNTLGKDIHEDDSDFMIQSYYSALKMADRYQWLRVACVRENRLRDIGEIHQDVYRGAMGVIDHEG